MVKSEFQISNWERITPKLELIRRCRKLTILQKTNFVSDYFINCHCNILN